VELNHSPDTSRYARLLAWAVRVGLVLLALAFLADIAGFGRDIALERMPDIWRAPAAAHGRGASRVMLVAIGWLATCSVACLVPLLPILRRRGETALAAICLLHVVVLSVAVWAGLH